MKNINQLKIFLIVSTIFAVLITISFTMQNDNNNIIFRMINDGVSVVQRGYTNLAHGIRNFGETTVDLFDTFEENRRLRERMYNYETLNLQMALLEEENESLRTMLDISGTLTDFTRMQAMTISRDINHWHDFIIINKGNLHGVEEGMPVISKEGYLIGRVTEVGEISARVHLLKQHNTRISAHAFITGNPESFGILEGYDPVTNELIMVQVDRDVEIEEGDQVITSGLGGGYPTGLLIGYVSRTEISSDGLNQTVFITNGVNYSNLNFVFLINREAPESDL